MANMLCSIKPLGDRIQLFINMFLIGKKTP